MNHLIIFPYWCQDELDRYSLLADNWEKLTVTDHELKFLFVARWDSQHEIGHLVEKFRKHGEVSATRCYRPNFGVPGRPSRHVLAKYMFVQCMQHIMSAWEDDGGFVFWVEFDIMFMKNDWVDKLHDIWTNSDLVLLGHKVNVERMPELLMEDPPMPEHFNGVACYSKRLLDYVALRRFYETYRSFDVLIFDNLRLNGFANKTHASDMWDHRLDFWCKPTRMDEDVADNVRILHGCKDIADFKRFMGIAMGGNG